MENIFFVYKEYYTFTLLKISLMEKIISIPEQVEIALDGRPRRWLALRIMMPEDELSKRMSGKKEFTDDEIRQINILLKSKIKFKTRERA